MARRLVTPSAATTIHGREPTIRHAAPTLSGARESSAGDQFHFLWAARRVVALLDPSSRLELVRVEGFSPNEPVSRSSDLLLGADLVEYYGGRSFDAADEICVSQLKYSSRHPDTAWTAARLCAPTRRGGPTVIGRLAQLYLATKGTHGRRDTLRKLRLRLVSNQPATLELTNALATAQQVATTRRSPQTASQLIACLDAKPAKVIRRLNEAAGLSEGEFVDFLSLLDLGDCGAESRALSEARLAAEVRKHLPEDYESAADRIYRTIEAEAMPEADVHPGLTCDDVLAMFGLDSKVALFPAPVRFEPVENAIRTQDVATLAEALITGSHPRFVVHGEAGTGKTTTLTLLQDALPTGSIVVTYDCFGGGSYLDPAESRHLPRQATLQIINELARRCGTPILLKPPTVVPDLWRILRDRLSQAASVLDTHGGLLVIAIDAADNAALAAAEFGDQCSLPRIWQLQLPRNARLLVTARTHRVPLVAPPTHVPQLILTGFDLGASSKYLRRLFPDADEAACRLFHERSSGNPRVQSYVLDRSIRRGLPLRDALEDADRTPAALFEDIVQSGIDHSPKPALAGELLANLLSMARPALVSTFARASGVTAPEAEAFCHGLAPGIRLREGSVAFRDEDFEQHLRSVVGDGGEREAHHRLGQYFLSREETDHDAAVAVGEHLFRAREFAQLVAFTLKRGEPLAIRDPVVRLQAYRRRITFALRAALAADARADAFRLTVLAGEAARTSSAVENVIRDRPDLAMRHGDPRGVAEVYLRQSNAPWRGPLHLAVASMYAREGERELASDHMNRARAWYAEARRRETRDTNGDWHLAAIDIARGAETRFWLGDLADAVRWLDQWGPPDVRFRAITELAGSLASSADANRLIREGESCRLAGRVDAVFRAALWNAGAHLPSDGARELAIRVARGLRRSPLRLDAGRLVGQHADRAWVVPFGELAVALGVDPPLVRSLFRLAAQPLPTHAPLEWESLDDHDLTLRQVSLDALLQGREVTVDDILPERLRVAPPDATWADRDKISSEQRCFRERFEEVLPAYRLRARIIASPTRVAAVSHEVRRQLALRRRNAEQRWAKFDHRYRLWAETVSDALLRAQGDPTQLLQEIADTAEMAVHAAAPQVWLGLARKASRRPALHALACGLADRAACYVQTHDMPATERTHFLLDVACSVDRVDRDLAHDYYGRAVQAAAGIDDDSVTLLELHSRLIDRLAVDPPASASTIAARAIRLVESFQSRVSNEERLPYLQTLEATARLHSPTALAACSRWDDEMRLPYQVSLDCLVRGVSSSGFLSVRDSFLLLRLAGERHDISPTCVYLLELLRRRGQPGRRELQRILDEAARWIQRDQALATRPRAAARVRDWAASAGFGDTASMGELTALIDYGATSVSEVAALSAGWGKPRSKARRKTAIRPAHPEQLSDNLHRLAEQFASEDEIAAYIERSGVAAGPTQRLRFLRALVELPSDHIAIRWHPIAVVTALGQLLTRWRDSRPVAEWAATGIPTFVEDHLTAFVAYEEVARTTLSSLLTMPFAVEPGALLTRGLASHLDELSAAQLFGIADALAAALASEQVEEVVSWSMGRLDGATPVQPLADRLNDPNEALASFFFAAFGAMDRRSRWRAAHAARAILNPPRQGLVDALVAKAVAQDAEPFASNLYPFHWMSARQWLFLVLARTADEHPASLRAHLALLMNAASDRSFPHAAIRDMAKRAALSVGASDRDALTDSQLAALTMANEPVACFIDRHYRAGRGDSRAARKPSRFRFDAMDTMPYWFEPLGRIFGVGAHEVADRAEAWIVDRLAFTDEDVWADKRELSREGQWQEMNNRQGDVPVLETLRSYLEYHSMLLAAGEMVDKGLPVAYTEWDAEPGPWRAWLSRHLEMSSERWLADLRTPAPLEPFVYRELPQLETWLKPTERDFHEQLVLARGGEAWIVLDAYLEFSERQRRGHVRIHSALVARETAHSLLRALQTATNSSDYRLPNEDDVEDFPGDGFRIDQGEFQLEGLLARVRREGETLEEHDPLARIRYAFQRPGVSYQTVTLSRPAGPGLTLESCEGFVTSETVLWNDATAGERDHVLGRQTEGTRTVVPLGTLLTVLKELGRCLISVVEIDRKVDRRYEGGSSEYEPPPMRVYVLRETGVLETLERRRRLGRSNRPRPRPGRVDRHARQMDVPPDS